MDEMLHKRLVNSHIARATLWHGPLSTRTGVTRTTLAFHAVSVAVQSAEHLTGRRGYAACGRSQTGGARVTLAVGLATSTVVGGA